MTPSHSSLPASWSRWPTPRPCNRPSTTQLTRAFPVITIDSDAPASKRLYFIGTNNLQAGRLGGQRIIENLHGKGNVVFYTIPQTNVDERLKGYKDVFADHPASRSSRSSIPMAIGQRLRSHPALAYREGRGPHRCLRLPGFVSG